MQNPPGKTALGLDKNVGAMLCYLPVCLVSLIYSIIVLVTDKDNRDMRFHAFQSILLAVAFFVLYIGVIVITMVGAAANSSLIALLGSLLWIVVLIGFLALMIWACISAYQGKQIKFPVVADMAEKWANS